MIIRQDDGKNCGSEGPYRCGGCIAGLCGAGHNAGAQSGTFHISGLSGKSAGMAALDQGVFNAVFTLFAGKAYAIFSLLFGFTFFLQMDGQREKGKDFGWRFLWRLVLLAGFATLDAAFFPAGDVLLLFTVVGLLLFLVRHWSDRAVLILAVLFLLQPVEWFHYIASLVNPAHHLPDLKVGEMYAQVAEVTKSGYFWDFILCNITLGQKAACCGQSMQGVSSRLPGCSCSGSGSAENIALPTIPGTGNSG